MNNKNVIGLIVYIAIMMVVAILPLWCAYSFFFALGCSQHDSCINSVTIMESIFVVLGIFVAPILYLLLPIIITILAIKNHWSSYLDKFFNQHKYPTFIFIIVLFIISIYKHFDLLDGNHSTLLWDLYYAVVPPYCLIYSVILIHNIYQKLKTKHKIQKTN